MIFRSWGFDSPLSHQKFFDVVRIGVMDNGGMSDRQRQSPRVTLSEPQEILVGQKRGFVIDVSAGGFRVTQHEKPIAPGQPRKLTFEWEGRRAAFLCELRWLRVQQTLGKASYSQNVYHAGYRVIHGTAEAHDVVRAIMRSANKPSPSE
ncbi:MAG: hypothetical protein NVSMB68_14410 [Thermoanaerobaculia bacterium]